MMNYFREGGFSMWLILIAALGTGGYAIGRNPDARPRVLFRGAIGVLALGLLGVALGMEAVSDNYARFGDKTAAVAQGLGELANNGTFAFALFALLALAGVILERSAAKE